MNSKSASTYEEVQELADKNKCEFIDLKFVDLPGSWQHLTLTISKLTPDLFEEGMSFDGSSIRGFQKINASDMLLIPDENTAFIDPMYTYPTLCLICDVVDPISRKNYGRDPRLVAKRAETYLINSGVADVSYWGPEMEFFIFDSVNFNTDSHESYYHINAREGQWNSGNNTKDNSGYYIPKKEGYFTVPPSDQMFNLRSMMAKAMMQAGLDIELHHHEVATAGQTEIGMHYGTLVQQADRVLLNKYIAKNVAVQNGYTATFMPKPLYLDNGNAMHVHQSLWKNGTNLFYDADGYALLSDVARHYIGGLLSHSPALLALCCPSTNSYRRLVPGYEAPVYLVYSQRNRSAAVRIPAYSPVPQARRIEYRCPDATCNPYLAFAAMLMAGLDGIKNKIEPGQPFDNDIHTLEAGQMGLIKSVPGSLDEVLKALAEDHEFLTNGGVFTADLIETWIDYKNNKEVKAVSLRPHPFEFTLYYDV